MRRIIATAAAVCLLGSGAAVAQTAETTPSDNAHKNAAVKNPDTAGPPSAGANSFTKGQAMKRMEEAGYTAVAGLAKDKQGLWHAEAMKDGKRNTVTLDFKGNVNSQ
jgi:opacity protein-like surface antigen